MDLTPVHAGGCSPPSLVRAVDSVAFTTARAFCASQGVHSPVLLTFFLLSEARKDIFTVCRSAVQPSPCGVQASLSAGTQPLLAAHGPWALEA